MEGGKIVSFPIASYLKLCHNDYPKSDAKKDEMAKVPYLVASCIAYEVGVVNRYMSNTWKKHLDAVKGVIRYLKGTRDMRICFGSKEACVEGCKDVDYVRDVDKRRSMSRYIFMLIGGDVSWQSCLQNCVFMSTIEAK